MSSTKLSAVDALSLVLMLARAGVDLAETGKAIESGQVDAEAVRWSRDRMVSEVDQLAESYPPDHMG